MPMSINMSEFMFRLKQANGGSFNLEKSSLKGLVNALRDPNTSTRTNDEYTIDEQGKEAIQKAIWGTDSGQNSIPLEKRKKYRRALEYVAECFWPQNTDAARRIVLKKLETKKQNFKLGREDRSIAWFIHCSQVQPHKLYIGLDPEHSREVCIEQNNLIGSWSTHEFVFAFSLERNQDPLKAFKGAQKFGFDNGGYVYIFRRYRGCNYRSADSKLQHGSEVAFPGKIKIEDICIYTYENNAGRKRLKFQEGFHGFIEQDILKML